MAEITDYDFTPQSPTGTYQSAIVEATGDSGDTVVVDSHQENVNDVLYATAWNKTDGVSAPVAWDQGTQTFTVDSGNGNTGKDYVIKFLFS